METAEQTTKVFLKGQPMPVTLVEIERDDDVAVIGRTNTGKRFVAARAEIAVAPEELPEIPARHPYRVYLKSGMALRVIHPAFNEAEEWYLSGVGELSVVLADRTTQESLDRTNVLSILSAAPEDERAATAQAN